MKRFRLLSRVINFIRRKYFRKERFFRKKSHQEKVESSTDCDYSPSLEHNKIASRMHPALSFDSSDPEEWRSQAQIQLNKLLGYEEQSGLSKAETIFSGIFNKNPAKTIRSGLVFVMVSKKVLS